MMGQHNPDLQRGFDSVFECLHFDWYPYGVNSHKLQIDVLDKFNSFQPDFVFMHLQGDGIITDDLAKMMAEKSVVVNWTGDVRQILPSFYISTGKNIHSTLFTNMNDADYCSMQGVNAGFLQVGYDSQHFNIFGDTDEKNITYPEIIFMGSNYTTSPFPLTQLRYEMVTRLKKEFGNRFGFYGGGWEGANGNITSYAEEGKAYRSCKIAINLSHFAYRRYSSDRMFRILGSGAFCLTHHFPEIEKDFEVGKELVVWENIDDLVIKIKKYLAKDEEREKIALNGYNKAITKFTWHHFANNLNDIYNKLKEKR